MPHMSTLLSWDTPSQKPDDTCGGAQTGPRKRPRAGHMERTHGEAPKKGLVQVLLSEPGGVLSCQTRE